MNELLDGSAVDLAATIVAGEVTAEQVVEAVLERIDAAEPSLRAWAYLDRDLALSQARARDAHLLDAGEPVGVLHGVPIGIKDIVDTADQPTAHGSPIYQGRRPDADATVVARLRAAGAVIVGKTVTTEFALFAPGPTRNPHDLMRTPGGSSSGSAAAVTAGMVPLAVGTQTAGSIVRPASFCGIYGAKPTYGRVPTDGVKRCSRTLDTVGILSRLPDDAAVALDVMAADHPRVRPHAGGPPRIGFCRTPEWAEVDPDTRARIERAVEHLATVVDVRETTLPAAFESLVDTQRVIMAVEVLEALESERTDHAEQLSPQLREYLDDASGEIDRYDDAMAHARDCRAMLGEVFADVDVLLAPSVLGEAPDAATTGDPLLCRMWTLLGTPAVAVPGLRSAGGLPLGVQVIGPPGADRATLAAAGTVGAHLAGTS